MADTSNPITTGLSIGTYGISAGLVFGDIWHFLNDNAGAIGVCLAFLTYFTNLFFKIRYERKK